MRPADTTPDARAVQVAAYRAMSGAERLRLALVMSEEIRQLAQAGRARRRATSSP